MVVGVLAGYRIIDMTTVLAGPLGVYQLALLGADVIKVEVPGTGDVARDFGADADLRERQMGPSFLASNSQKSSVTINLKSDGGREAFRRLVRASDALVENMRPGVLARLGFSPDELLALNPDLVYCSLTGFGSSGPLAQYPAYDQIIQGLAGMASVTGFPDGDGVRVGFPVCDALGGYVAALAVAAGLANTASPRGVYLDVAMLDAALSAMSWVSSEALFGRHPRRIGNDNAASSPSGTFYAADGPLNIATNTLEQFRTLCRVVGRDDLPDDPRFATREDRKARRSELSALLNEALSLRTVEEWVTELAAEGVPSGPLLEVPDALHQPQVRSRGLVHQVTLPGPDSRQVSVLGSPIHVNGEPLRPERAPAELGSDTERVLLDVGCQPEEIARWREEGAI
ncbi:MAG: CoA transferase [Acidobacteria bacterium]|nr:CoA transferase [Acidobacteriota bacterium]